MGAPSFATTGPLFWTGRVRAVRAAACLRRGEGILGPERVGARGGATRPPRAEVIRGGGEVENEWKGSRWVHSRLAIPHALGHNPPKMHGREISIECCFSTRSPEDVWRSEVKRRSHGQVTSDTVSLGEGHLNLCLGVKTRQTWHVVRRCATSLVKLMLIKGEVTLHRSRRLQTQALRRRHESKDQRLPGSSNPHRLRLRTIPSSLPTHSRRLSRRRRDGVESEPHARAGAASRSRVGARAAARAAAGHVDASAAAAALELEGPQAHHPFLGRQQPRGRTPTPPLTPAPSTLPIAALTKVRKEE